MKINEPNNFFRLILWELQEFLNFPMLEILVIVIIYSVLKAPSPEISISDGYSNLRFGLQDIFFFMIFAAAIFISRSFGASISKGEIKTLLSYPLKRWQVFSSKFAAIYFVLLCIYTAVFSVQIYLLKLSIFEPMFYVSVLGFGLQLLLMCSVTTVIVLVVKNEVISSFASVLLLYGLENIVSPMSVSSYRGRFDILFGFLGVVTRGRLPVPMILEYTLSDALLAVFVPLGISALLLFFAVTYFVRMEID